MDYICFFNTEKILNDNSYKLEDETYKGATAQNKQIEILTSLLDQQQRLALQDKKLLEEYKEEINVLKSLGIPARENEKDRIAQKFKDIDKKEEPQKKKKRWWPFGKM
ncbi:plasmid replication protein [Lactococcus lactis]|uniref:plasmid replication protein n=1 Tax=Lactococcus lactis TaxID=1358 RepID=UPI0037BE4B25